MRANLRVNLKYLIVAVALVSLNALAQQSTPGSTQPQVQDGKDTSAKHKFSQLFMAAGAAGDGTPLDIRTFETPDGIKLTTVHGQFSTPEAASAELHRRMAEASKIVEQGSRTAFGLPIGERVVAIIAPMKKLPERPTVLLTDGSDFYQISST